MQARKFGTQEMYVPVLAGFVRDVALVSHFSTAVTVIFHSYDI